MFTNPASASEAIGSTIRGSYNSFLGQSCRLRVNNGSSAPKQASVRMTRHDGTVVLSNLALQIPGFGSKEIDLCDYEWLDAYGEVVVTTNAKVLNGEVIRHERNNRIEFGIPLK